MGMLTFWPEAKQSAHTSTTTVCSILAGKQTEKHLSSLILSSFLLLICQQLASEKTTRPKLALSAVGLVFKQFSHMIEQLAVAVWKGGGSECDFCYGVAKTHHFHNLHFINVSTLLKQDHIWQQELMIFKKKCKTIILLEAKQNPQDRKRHDSLSHSFVAPCLICSSHQNSNHWQCPMH